MNASPRELVGIVGAGLMGREIGALFRAAGFAVSLVDRDPDALEDARRFLREEAPGRLEAAGYEPDSPLPEGVSTSVDLDCLRDAVFVVEAIPDRLGPKQRLMNSLEAWVDEATPIGTNTSSLTAREVAEGMEFPGRLFLFHFANPAIERDLLEVAGELTEPSYLQRAEIVGERIGKRPVRLQRERRGNGLSRLSAAIKCASCWELIRAEAGAIERAARAVGFQRGPLALIDLIGLDVHLDTVSNLSEEYGDRFEPPPSVRHRMETMVDEGRLGKKTGRGFFRWEGDSPRIPEGESDYDITPVVAALVNEAHLMREDAIADRDTINTVLKRGSGGDVGPFEVGDLMGYTELREVLEERFNSTGSEVFRPADSLGERDD